MAKIFEIIMVVLFDIAMFTGVFKFIHNINVGNMKTQPIYIGFAAGFLFGIIAQCLSGGDCAVIILYVLGFILSCIDFIFGVLKKKESR